MKDFGIFLIKPDGIEQEIELECENEILEHNLEIVAKKQSVLTANDINKYFYYQLSDYINYMCSGPVTAYLLSAVDLDIDRELFLIKDAIRKRHAVSGQDLKNLVHASHCGTEYFRQRKLFFPEYEKGKYTSYSDMLVSLPDYSVETILLAKKILDSSWIKRICFNIPLGGFEHYKKLMQQYFNQEGISFLFSITTKVLDYTCNLYCYCPSSYEIIGNKSLEEIKNDPQITIALGEIYPIDFQINVECVASFRQYVRLCNTRIGSIIIDAYKRLTEQGFNITHIVVNTSNMELIEAETRYEVMQYLRLSFIGGSNNWKNLGIFGISKTKFNEILKC